MFRQSSLVKLSTWLWLSIALTLPALAQGKKESDGRSLRQRIEITILSVTKDDAGAKPVPNGPGRLVPVTIQWRTGPSNGAQLLSLDATLRTTNTDGSTTEVKKALAVRATSDTLTLPMPQGVFAKAFVLTLNSKCSLTEANGESSVVTSQTSKRGDFPVPPERK